jgi:translocation and assembly module TamA
MTLNPRILCTSAVVLSLASAPLVSRAEMTLSGLNDRQAANVMALAPLASTDCDSARWRVERLFRDADQEIINALRALGYYAPQIN